MSFYYPFRKAVESEAKHPLKELKGKGKIYFGKLLTRDLDGENSHEVCRVRPPKISIQCHQHREYNVCQRYTESISNERSERRRKSTVTNHSDATFKVKHESVFEFDLLLTPPPPPTYQWHFEKMNS